MATLSVFVGLFFLGVLTAPFPYWPNYFALWGAVLFDRSNNITLRMRLQHARRLTTLLMLTPLYSFLWWLDELFFSDYHLERIERPVFIASQPRSGTTLLHRTLARNEEVFFSIRHIEWRLPYIGIQKLIDVIGLRGYVNGLSYWPRNRAGVQAAKMHQMYLGDYEEDGVLFEERFLCHPFILTRFPYYELREKFYDLNIVDERYRQHMTKIYSRVVQKVKYLRGNPLARYLSKEVLQPGWAERMREQYPDATFVGIVRAATPFVRSMLKLIASSTKAKTGLDIDTPAWRTQMHEQFRRNTRMHIAFYQALGLSKQILLSYDLTVEELSETIEYIYARLDLTISLEELKRLQAIERKEILSGDSETDIPGFDGWNWFAIMADLSHYHRKGC